MSETLTPRQRELLDEAMEACLVETVAAPYVGRYRGLVSEEDVIGLAKVGLMDALVRHDDEAGPFDYYARLRIRGAIRDGVRVEAIEKAGKLRLKDAAEAGAEDFCMSFRDPGYSVTKHDNAAAARMLGAFAAGLVDCALGRVLSEVDRTPEERVGDVKEYLFVRGCYRKAQETLPPKERQVLDMYFIERMSMEAIAARLDVNYKTVEARRDNGLERLRKRMIELGVRSAQWQQLPAAVLQGLGRGENDGGGGEVA